jgi:hypothetical protein
VSGSPLIRFRIVAALVLTGCTGMIGTPPPVSPDAVTSPQLPGDGPLATASPLSRMTALQYNNTLRDLFAPLAVPAQDVPADIPVESFDNNAGVQTPSAALIEAYQASADAVAAAATGSAGFLGCVAVDRAGEDACAAQFLGTFLPRAFRRPVTAAELSDFTGFYAATRTDGSDFTTAMTVTLSAVLQSPEFLYRVEIGTPIPGRSGAVALTPYEVASRLSYFLWNTMPDAVLLDAAASGALSTRDGVRAQAERMLNDAQARAAVANFHRQFLRLDTIAGLTKDSTLFPAFSDATVRSLKASTAQYVDDLFFSGGSFTALMTDDHAWVDDQLAAIYGVPSPGPGLTRVQVDGTQRSGVLTQAGLMAAFAHATADSPVLRGVFVLRNVICEDLPPPPPGVNTSPPAASTGMAMTTRQAFASQHEQGSCASCHHTIDGIGFGFEHYDAIGAWRTEDSGLSVDATGWFTASYDPALSGTFDGAVELGQKLARSPIAQACLVKNWLHYALGVDHHGIDSKGLAPIVAAFQGAQLDMHTLVIAVATSDAFNTRVLPGAMQ